ncbi:MAG: CD0415/CD1112 family protein [Defluviitaleaceae bacterium]|nr:CD0415/CD1112 family protein [Defluviitaleaceae bacterium]
MFILTNTFSIVMAIFALAQNAINASATAITGNIEVNADAALAMLEAQLQEMGVWELLGLWLETWLITA